MVGQDQPGALSPCPPFPDLENFFQGKISREHQEAIAVHLNSCQTCDSHLSQLNQHADLLADALRREAKRGGAQEDDPPEMAGLIERVLSLWRDSTDPSSSQARYATVRDPKGVHIGQYQLVSEIGAGGMGNVYRALHTALGKTVAVKLISPWRVAHPEAVVRFQREMKAIGRLHHPHIVNAFDAGEAQGEFYLAMELLEGINLLTLVKRQSPLSIPNACEAVRQAALGLQHIHNHGLVHRDLKPSNLMLTTDGQVKILDLGLALLVMEPLDEAMVTGGVALGTADYMAPEQVQNAHGVDIRADIYSLGCTLYQLLSARAPFADPAHHSALQKLMAHVNQEPPPVDTLRADLPAELITIVQRMMAKDPQQRFSTPQQIAEAVAPFAQGADLASLAVLAQSSNSAADIAVETPTPQPVPLASVPRTRHAWPWAAAIAIAVVAAVAVWLSGLLIHVRTPEGTLVLEIDQPGVVVTIDGENRLEVSQPGEQPPLKIAIAKDPADKTQKHTLQVSKNGVEIYTQEFSLADDENRRIRVQLLPPVADFQEERQAAIGALRLGGVVNVRLATEKSTVAAKEERLLPEQPFTVYAIYLQDKPGVTNNELAGLQGLEQLAILNLKGTQITDAGIKHLTDLNSLTTLNLAATAITDQALDDLHRVRNLRELDVSDTAVTTEGIQRLQQSLPNCRVKS